jgi:hypothetical protein
VPPGGTAFALEEGGARVLVASPQPALVARVLDVIVVEFRIMDPG